MGFAAAGLLGVGMGLRVGLFGLLTLSALAFCVAFGAPVLTGKPVLESASTGALYLTIFEISVLAGMAVRQGLLGTARETPRPNQAKQTEDAETHGVRALS